MEMLPFVPMETNGQKFLCADVLRVDPKIHGYHNKFHTETQDDEWKKKWQF
jgi:hypothetical protein